MHEHAQGLGFRGDIFGGYILYNLGFIESEDRYFIGDEEIQNDKQYTLGTVDMYTFGRYFPLLKGYLQIILCLNFYVIFLKRNY